MGDWEKGKIGITSDKKGHKHYFWKFQKAKGGEGQIELYPSGEALSMLEQGGDLEVKRADQDGSRNFQVKCGDRVVMNQPPLPPPRPQGRPEGGRQRYQQSGGGGGRAPFHSSSPPTKGAPSFSGAAKGGAVPSWPGIPHGVRCLPRETESFLKNLPGPIWQGANPAQLWHRLLWTYQDGSLTIDSKEKDSFPKVMESLRLESPQRVVSEHLASLEAGLKKTFEDRFRSVELALVSPLVHGVGNDTPLEVGLTLHDVYGVPYLPGSTLKGIARAWATALLADKGAAESGGDFYKLWKEFDKALDRGECPAVKGADPDLFGRASRVFGCLTRAGAVSFLDAFPQGDFRFKADIMNPHFPEYYSEGRRKPPVENQNPIPVYFLVVTGGRFHFHLLAVDPKDSVLLKSASEWLIGGLTNLGAGGKTSAGYGRFAAD